MINHGKMDNGPLHPDWGRTPSLPNVAEDMARLIRERDAAVAATITFDKTDIAEMLTAAEAEKARAVEAERERCAVICEEQAQVFGSEEYAFGQPMSSFKERFACKSIAAEIRNGTNPSTCYCGRAVCSYEADTGCGIS